MSSMSLESDRVVVMKYAAVVNQAVTELSTGLQAVLSRNIDPQNPEFLEWFTNDSTVSQLISYANREAQRQAHGEELKPLYSVIPFKEGPDPKSDSQQHLARAIIKTVSQYFLSHEAEAELQAGNVALALKELNQRVAEVMLLQVVFNSHPMYVIARMALLEAYEKAFRLYASFDTQHPEYKKQFVWD